MRSATAALSAREQADVGGLLDPADTRTKLLPLVRAAVGVDVGVKIILSFSHTTLYISLVIIPI
jgi:hypothetical protein